MNNMLMRVALLAVVLGFLAPGCAQSEPPSTTAGDQIDGIRGRVQHAFDGDSFILQSDGKRIDVRVFGIDAPEKGQPFSKKSRSRAKKLLEGQAVVIEVTTERDRHGRVVGNVYLPDGRNYAHILVSEGLAWQFRRFSKDPEVARLEQEARSERRGLWQEKDPEPPWEYRSRNRRKG